jgi:hypothetical protein
MKVVTIKKGSFLLMKKWTSRPEKASNIISWHEEMNSTLCFMLFTVSYVNS